MGHLAARASRGTTFPALDGCVDVSGALPLAEEFPNVQSLLEEEMISAASLLQLLVIFLEILGLIS